MSSTKTPKAAEEIGKPNEPGGRNSGVSTKELGANSDAPATLTEGEAKRKRRNRDRLRRRRESRHAIREGLAEGGGTGTKEAKEVPKEGRIVKAAVSKQPNKLQTPKKQDSGEPKAATHNAVPAEGNGGSGVSGWRMSSALGGRFLPLDMVFSEDEKFFLLAHSCSLKIYSVKTSLQVREFSLDSKPSEVITCFKLDSLDSSKVYIGTSASTIYSVDWTTGKLVKSWQLSNVRTIQCLTICVDEKREDDETHGIIYVGGSGSKNPSTIIERIRLSLSVAPIEDRVYVAPKPSPIECMQVLGQGNIVTAIAGNTLIIGNKDTEEYPSAEKPWGVFRHYPMSFHLACMDAYLPGEPDIIKHKGGGPHRGSGRGANQLGDVVVGDNMGALHLFHNVLRVEGVPKGAPVISKMHWHRSRVRAVKWALDGKYIISGGSETVLVIWQLGTGFKQFLPHLGATIQNIAISPRGSSYGVGFADNSVMVLSTTEFKPTSSVTGIQSRVFHLERGTEYPRFTCIMHPTLPNRLLLASPSSQTDLYSSASFLQTFDISSTRQVYRQPLTRSNITSVNQGPDEYKIKEPDIPHLAITKDGKWLASIDEWKPPKKNSFYSNEDGRSSHEGDSDQGEVSLKFWKWGEKSLSWELATIVKSPHPSFSGAGPEGVLDLVAAPKAHLFATLAGDGSIRLWKPKVRARDGARLRREDSEIAVWSCRKVIKFSKGKRGQQILAQNLLSGMSPQKAWWGSAAFSEDNSVIAAAVPNSLGNDSVIYLADSSSGTIAHFLSGLQVGKSAEIAILERYLVILGTSKLLVWNMVNGTVQWEFNLKTLLSVDNPVTHLAVDYVSQTFAITISQRDSPSPKIFVFEAPHPTPVHIQRFEYGYQIMALIGTDTGKGYVALDNQARVRCLSPILAGPVQRVPVVGKEEEQEALAVSEDEPTIGTLSGAYLSTATPTMSLEDRMDLDYAKDDGVVDHIVSREVLENILDSTPSYAIGSLEHKFDQVLQLFAKGPLLNDDGDSDDDADCGGMGDGKPQNNNGEDAMEV